MVNAWGLTRYVAFLSPPMKSRQIRDAVMHLNALLFTETRPGKNVRDIFRRLIDAYGSAGYPGNGRIIIRAE